jgi:hypothetical protein
MYKYETTLKVSLPRPSQIVVKEAKWIPKQHYEIMLIHTILCEFLSAMLLPVIKFDIPCKCHATSSADYALHNDTIMTNLF